MAATTVENLEFHIKRTGEDGKKAVKDLKEALKELNSITKAGLNQNFMNNLSALSQAMKRIDGVALRNVRSFGSALEGLGRAKISNTLSTRLDSLTTALGKLTDAQVNRLTRLSQALSGLMGGRISINEMLPATLMNLAGAMDHITMGQIARLTRLSQALSMLRGVDLRGLATVLQNTGRGNRQAQQGGTAAAPTDTGATRQQMQNYRNLFDMAGDRLASGFQTAGRAVSAFAPAVKELAKYLTSCASNALKLAKNLLMIAGRGIKLTADKFGLEGVKSALGKIQGFFKSLGRIAFYRAIRSAIKYVTQTIKEGSENAYFYSKKFGDSTKYISESLDQLSSKNYTTGNQLGAAWATLLATIQPILLTIISLIQRAASALTAFFALLGGKSTYLKAIDYTKAWADETNKGAKAAKEWKNQLLSFDEINKLDEPSDSSGGGSSVPDYGSMFEEAEIQSDFFDSLKEAFQNGEWAKLGNLLGQKVNEIVDSIDTAALGRKIGYAINSAVTVAYNFLKSVDFVNIGRKIGDFLVNAMDEIDFQQLGALMVRKITAALDVVYGLITTPGFMHDLAVSLSDFFIGALNEFTSWVSSLEPQEVANAIREFFDGLKEKKDEIGQALKEALKVAVDFALAVTEDLFPEGVVPTLCTAISNLFTKVATALKDEDFQEAHNILQYKIDKAIFGEKWANFWWSQGDYAGKDIVQGMINGVDTNTPDLEGAIEKVGPKTRSKSSRTGEETVEGFWEGFKRKADESWKQSLLGKFINKILDKFRGKEGFDCHSPSKVMSEIGKNVVQGFLNGLKDSWDSIVKFFETSLKTIFTTLDTAWNNMKTQTQTIWNGIKTDLSNAWNSIKTTAITSWNTIRTNLTTIWNGICTTASSVWGTLRTTAATTWSTISSTASSAWSVISSTATTAWNGIVSTVSNAVNSVISAVENMLSGVGGAVSSVKSWLGDAVSSAFSAASSLGEAVSDMVEDAREFASNASTAARNAYNSVSSSVSSAVSTAVSSASTTLKNVVNKIKNNLFASGGFPEDGLFFANHGEMVGQFSNGRTAVANNDQIVEGIREGVYEAVTAALSNGGGSSDKAVNIYLDGKLLAQSTTRYQRQFARAAG